jgi:hypothetical protein
MHDTSSQDRAIKDRQEPQTSFPQEIAFCNKWISKAELSKPAERSLGSNYRKCLAMIAEYNSE